MRIEGQFTDSYRSVRIDSKLYCKDNKKDLRLKLCLSKIAARSKRNVNWVYFHSGQVRSLWTEELQTKPLLDLEQGLDLEHFSKMSY